MPLTGSSSSGRKEPSKKKSKTSHQSEGVHSVVGGLYLIREIRRDVNGPPNSYIVTIQTKDRSTTFTYQKKSYDAEINDLQNFDLDRTNAYKLKLMENDNLQGRLRAGGIAYEFVPMLDCVKKSEEHSGAGKECNCSNCDVAHCPLLQEGEAFLDAERCDEIVALTEEQIKSEMDRVTDLFLKEEEKKVKPVPVVVMSQYRGGHPQYADSDTSVKPTMCCAVPGARKTMIPPIAPQNMRECAYAPPEESDKPIGIRMNDLCNRFTRLDLALQSIKQELDDVEDSVGDVDHYIDLKKRFKSFARTLGRLKEEYCGEYEPDDKKKKDKENKSSKSVPPGDQDFQGPYDDTDNPPNNLCGCSCFRKSRRSESFDYYRTTPDQEAEPVGQARPSERQSGEGKHVNLENKESTEIDADKDIDTIDSTDKDKDKDVKKTHECCTECKCQANKQSAAMASDQDQKEEACNFLLQEPTVTVLEPYSSEIRLELAGCSCNQECECDDQPQPPKRVCEESFWKRFLQSFDKRVFPNTSKNICEQPNVDGAQKPKDSIDPDVPSTSQGTAAYCNDEKPPCNRLGEIYCPSDCRLPKGRQTHREIEDDDDDEEDNRCSIGPYLWKMVTEDMEITSESSDEATDYCALCNARTVCCSNDLVSKIQNLVNQAPKDNVALSVLQRPDNTFHISIVDLNARRFGCFLATEGAIVEAKAQGLFDKFLTFFVVDSRCNAQQKSAIVRHCFNLVDHDKKN